MRVAVKNNQSILDIAVQHSGTVEALFDILKANSLSDLIIEGMDSLEVPTVRNPKIIQHFQSRNKMAATLPIIELGGFPLSFSNAFNQ
jgi:hypothetical protein